MEDTGPVEGCHVSLNLVGKTTVVIEPVRQILHLFQHLRPELAVVLDFEVRQVFRICCDSFTHFMQRKAALRGGHCRPRPVLESSMGRGDGCIHIICRATGKSRPVLAGVRVQAFEDCASARTTPVAADAHQEFVHHDHSSSYVRPRR